jgi:hypothetical protein
MMDFPLTELLDERICTLWRECPLPPYRCRTCHGDYTRLTETMFEKT